MALTEWEKKVIKEIREKHGPWPSWVTDEEINNATKNAIFRIGVELNLGFCDIGDSLMDGIRDLIDWIKKNWKKIKYAINLMKR